MLFNSQAFICLFLPITLAVFFFLGRARKFRAAKVWVVLASFFFYAFWNPKFVVVLLASIIVNYAFGIFIGKTRPAPISRYLLIAAITVDLACLGYFKYANFFIANYNQLTNGGWAALHVTLPLGISFFTFTQIAFLVDVYRGIAVEFDFANYVLFVTYFPHLIAGPILHHKQMMPQFADAKTYHVRAENIVIGLTFFGIGLLKKLVIADLLSPYADAAFAVSEHGAVPLLTAWVGALTYTFQLYFDFSGYCDMAIGISRMFGVELPLNFNSPYQAASIIDFWRRWHMTLSRFLRDYVYISLGGNRLGKIRRHVNLLITMFLGGLWHGASWTFVVWGSLHGILLVINHLWDDLRPTRGEPSTLRRCGSIAATFLCVTLLWVFFRATTFSSAKNMLLGMTGLSGIVLPKGLERFLQHPAQILHIPGVTFDDAGMILPGSGSLHIGANFFLGYLLPVFVIAFALPNSQELVAKLTGLSWKSGSRVRAMHVAWGLALGIVLSVSIILSAHKSEFLYFQF
jgi:alginate O-acetyltransferase complex protein AlgI